MAPVSIDTILMEAAQMVDEWPMLEKKLGSLSKPSSGARPASSG